MAEILPIAPTPLLAPTPFALPLPDELSFEQWRSIGHRLCRAGHGLNWHIGDWWAFGEHRYGDRASAAAEGIFGLEYQTLRMRGTVSRAFEVSRRRNITWSHHAEVAGLPAATADALLDKAERQGLSTRDLRREAATLKAPATERVVEPQQEPSRRPDLMQSLSWIVELADALCAYRPLTEAEAAAVAEATAYLTGTGHWSQADRDCLKALANRRDWIDSAVERLPNRTVAALRCMMQKVREEMGLTQPRFAERASGADGRLLEALQLTGERPT